MREIYLDGAATTRVYPQVAGEIEKCMLKNYGNPSSMHSLGEKARKSLDSARKKISQEIGAKESEIFFTSGGTESNNLALKGSLKLGGKGKIVISKIEHASVYEAAMDLKKQGIKVVELSVDKEGLIKTKELEKTLDGKTKIVSVMHVNNIVGVEQDLEAIGKVCERKNVLFHTDAVQSFGKLKIDVNKMKISLLSGSGHKFGAPKGVGFIYVKGRVKVDSLLQGGGQERGLRSGTENIPGILGMAKALEVVRKEDKSKIKRLRDELIEKLEDIGGKINGSREYRIYNNINVGFSGLESGLLVQWLSQKGIYVSAGSACDSIRKKEDRVMEALGVKKRDYVGSIRITLDSNTTRKDIEFVARKIKEGVDKLKVKN